MKLVVKFAFPLIVCAAAFAQFPPQLKNVIVIMQENRTPDNFFHYLTPACPIPAGATGLKACIPSPVTRSCYDISPCGLSNQSGTIVPITLTGVPIVGPDAFHNHTAFEQQCDLDPTTFQCRNDGAWQTATNGHAYSYVLNDPVTNYDGSAGHLLDPYLTFAKQYGWANFMYQTNQGPSYPSHQFIFTGTSALSDSDDANSIFVSENTGGVPQAGCLMPASAPGKIAWNRVVQPASPPFAKGCFLFDANSVQECLVFNTLGPSNVGTFCTNDSNMATTVLDPHSISWKYYTPGVASLWTAPTAIQSICAPEMNAAGNLVCTGAEFLANVDAKNHGTDILRDIAACKLAQVSWAMPDGAWSDHAGIVFPTDRYGPSWVAAIINAIGTHPTCPAGTPDAGQTYWNNTAIVVTWDDWGGWADNQPPKLLGGLPCVFTTPPTRCPGDYQFGFRVPLLVVSAYTSKGFIHNGVDDYGSILRMIEGINHLKEGMMGNADARSVSDLRAFFTLKQPRVYQTVPALVDASFFLNYTGAVLAPDND
ncbi:MAG TPA: alkaline phosphatase family protein [Candidatus Sulfotelmatobacter sp.]|nr:alkaline phosphatase family protein [Candidatus Sulfotelmatobacter sp.]